MYGAYKAVNETPASRRERGWDRRGCDDGPRPDGKTLTTDGPFVAIKEALGGYLFYEGGDLDACDRARVAHSGGEHGRGDRDPAHRRGLVPLEQVFRDEWGRVLASLIGFLGDFDLAEEAAQAFAIAAERWSREGAGPAGAWLVTTARNRAIDRIRRDRTLAEKVACSTCGGGRGGRDDHP